MLNLFGKKKKSEVLRASIQTLIGHDTTVEGVVKFSGGMHVVGTVIGGVHSTDENSLLIVSEEALVQGDVTVNHLIVNGQIDGNVYVKDKVELFDKAIINGDVHYRTIELPVGAEVNGRLLREVDVTKNTSIEIEKPQNVSSIHERKISRKT